MSISRSRTVLTGGSMMPTSSEASTRMLARKTNSTSSETSVPVVRVDQAIMRIQNLHVPRRNRHLILGNHELHSSSRTLEKLASVFGEVGRVGITEIRDGWGNNPHTVFLSHYQWREDFTQSKPLGAVSTNWNAPELAEYAIPRMNNTLLLHGHTHAHDPLEFGRHHNEINVGLDAWRFEPVNEAELVDNWLHAALSAV